MVFLGLTVLNQALLIIAHFSVSASPTQNTTPESAAAPEPAAVPEHAAAPEPATSSESAAAPTAVPEPEAAPEPSPSSGPSSLEAVVPTPEPSKSASVATEDPAPSALESLSADGETAPAGSGKQERVRIDPTSGRIMSAPTARAGRVPPGGFSSGPLW